MIKVFRVNVTDTLYGDDVLYLPIREDADNVYDMLKILEREFAFGNVGLIVDMADVFETPDEKDKTIQAAKQQTELIPGKVDSVVKGLEGLPIIANPDNMTECELTGISGFTELMFGNYLYDTPYDDAPNGYMFLSELCADAYAGEIYIKDFPYYYCEFCGRYICYQNPNNGWHVQFKEMSDEMICNKCYEDYCNTKGMNYLAEDRKLDGLFCEPEGNEWSVVDGYKDYLIGMGRISNGEPDAKEKFLDKMEELVDSGKDIWVEILEMAIGGLGGSVTLWERVRK